MHFFPVFHLFYVIQFEKWHCKYETRFNKRTKKHTHNTRTHGRWKNKITTEKNCTEAARREKEKKMTHAACEKHYPIQIERFFFQHISHFTNICVDLYIIYALACLPHQFSFNCFFFVGVFVRNICNVRSVTILHFNGPVQENQELLALTHSQPLPNDACFSGEFFLRRISNHVWS